MRRGAAKKKKVEGEEGGEKEDVRSVGRGQRISLLLSFSLSALSSPLLVLLSAVHPSAALRVKLLLLVWFLVGDGGLLGLLQRVASLVLLFHPVHQQHHQEGGEQGTHHSADNHR